MRSICRLFATLTLFAFAAVPATAQSAPMPGTGCPTQTAPVCGTPPQINTNFIFRCPPTCFGTGITQFVVIGTPLSPVITFTPPTMCGPNPCTLVCRPLIVVAVPGATLAIPNNPALIGFKLCIQCLCVNASVPCFQISQGLSATIL